MKLLYFFWGKFQKFSLDSQTGHDCPRLKSHCPNFTHFTSQVEKPSSTEHKVTGLETGQDSAENRAIKRRLLPAPEALGVQCLSPGFGKQSCLGDLQLSPGGCVKISFLISFSAKEHDNASPTTQTLVLILTPWLPWSLIRGLYRVFSPSVSVQSLSSWWSGMCTQSLTADTVRLRGGR